MNKLQRYFIFPPLPLPTTEPQNTINEGDYTLAYYLIFTKSVSTKADVLKDLEENPKQEA